MDYQKFFNEVVNWINQCNQMAIEHGMNSSAFWEWVTTSTGEMCNSYNNNQLAIKQMAMLIEWLNDVCVGMKVRIERIQNEE